MGDPPKHLGCRPPFLFVYLQICSCCTSRVRALILRRTNSELLGSAVLRCACAALTRSCDEARWLQALRCVCVVRVLALILRCNNSELRLCCAVTVLRCAALCLCCTDSEL